jgi:signal transduction histidine kinase
VRTRILLKDDAPPAGWPYVAAMWLRRPPLTDLALAAGILALGLVELSVGQLDGPAPVGLVAVLCYPVALLLRRTSLWAAVLLGFSSIVVTYGLGLSQLDFLASIIACLVLVYHVGSAMPTRESVLAVVFAYLCVAFTDPITWGNLGWLVVIIGGAWGAGRAIRNRRMLIEDLRATAAELAASREELAHQVVAQERLRIAQDIHDVLAHSVSVMLVQAGVAERKAAREPALAADAARSIQESGRQAMDELRQMLGVLRLDEAQQPTTPQPGIDQIAGLVRHFRDAGLVVDYQGPDEGVPVPPAIGLTAYRVVQEGLTNVLRHSGAGRACLRVGAAVGMLSVEVADPGPAVEETTPPGHGLVGMRERVESCGGRLEIGQDASGFRLRASLPMVTGA